MFAERLANQSMYIGLGSIADIAEVYNHRLPSVKSRQEVVDSNIPCLILILREAVYACRKRNYLFHAR